MADIIQTYSNAFPWTKLLQFDSNFTEDLSQRPIQYLRAWDYTQKYNAHPFAWTY